MLKDLLRIKSIAKQRKIVDSINFTVISLMNNLTHKCEVAFHLYYKKNIFWGVIIKVILNYKYIIYQQKLI